MKNKILTRKRLLPIVGQLKRRGQTIITTNGIFDILHVGHVRCLIEAKKLGDVLIVAVNSDSSTRALKGPTRPINRAEDRAEVIGALECVDFAIIFNERDPCMLLEAIQPNIHVKGGDYKLQNLPEREIVERQGGKIVLIKPSRGYSTTATIDRATKKSHGYKPPHARHIDT